MTVKKTIILGLDPGLADTGYGLISKSGSRLGFLAAGSLRTSPRQNFPLRLEEIYQGVESLLKRYNPDVVAVEKLYFAKNIKTALDVGQARGVVMLALCRQHRPLIELTPLQVKQGVTASGTATKRQVALMVKSILALKEAPQSDDACDALAVAITAAFTNPRVL